MQITYNIHITNSEHTKNKQKTNI